MVTKVKGSVWNLEDQGTEFTQSGTGAVARTIEDKLGEVVSVKDFGAVGDGVTDDTAAIQAAIDGVGANGVVYFSEGVYKVTSTITISSLRAHLKGAGSWATQILFAPTADDICFWFDNSGSVLYQGSIQGFTFYSNDSTYTKTAIELVDTSGYDIKDIVIGGGVAVSGSSFWSGGAGSVGIRTRGREISTFQQLYIFADRPIVISNNPNSSIDIDHFHFTDCYLGANANPLVEIEDGTNLTSTTFDGYQAWVLGTHGLYWNDTTTTGSSNALILRGIRTEQGTSTSAYSVYIAHNQNLQNLVIDGCNFEYGRNGFYLRNVVDATLSNNYYTGGSGRTAINVDSSVDRLKFQNMFWQASATHTLTDQRLVFAGPALNGAYQDAIYSTLPKINTPITLGGAISEVSITLANDATAEIGLTGAMGMLFVQDSEGLGAIFHLRGAYNTVNEVSDPVGVFTTTATTASSTNVYWSAANSRYEIENKRGAERKYKILLIGSYSWF